MQEMVLIVAMQKENVKVDYTTSKSPIQFYRKSNEMAPISMLTVTTTVRELPDSEKWLL